MLDSVNGAVQIIYKQQKSETLPVNICRLTKICIAKLLVTWFNPYVLSFPLSLKNCRLICAFDVFVIVSMPHISIRCRSHPLSERKLTNLNKLAQA